MKNTWKLLIAAVTVLTLGLTACNKDDEDDNGNTPLTESTTYQITYNSEVVMAGDTIDNGSFSVKVKVKNITETNQQTYVKVERVAGSSAMNSVILCTNICYDATPCPFVSESAFTIYANSEQEVELKYFSLTPHKTEMNATYRITVGKGTSLDDPQIYFCTLTSIS